MAASTWTLAGCNALLGLDEPNPVDAASDESSLGDTGVDAQPDLGAETSADAGADAASEGAAETSAGDTNIADTSSTDTGPIDMGIDGPLCSTGASCVPTDNRCHTGHVCGDSPTCYDDGAYLADGTDCTASGGTNSVCSSGTCVACTSGSPCTPTAGVTPCHTYSTSCSTGTSVCADLGTTASIGLPSTCPSGDVCSTTGSCLACPTSCTPTANDCDVGTVSCTSGAVVCTDSGSPKTAGTTCSTGVCDGHGTCVTCSSGGPCTPPAPNSCFTGTQSCTTGAMICNATTTKVSDGSDCTPTGGLSSVCKSGVCAACAAGVPCTPTSGVVACHNYATSCSTGTSACVDAKTFVTPGSPSTCGTNSYCNAAGTCFACTQATACTPSTPCHKGTTDCSTGVVICNDAGIDATKVGTASTCPTGDVCNASGACTACAAGGPCTPTAGACHNGKYSCSTGAQTCADQGTTLGLGATCGTDMVCNPSNTCVSCVAGTPCSPTSPVACHTYATSCSTGASACADASKSALPGTTCGTDKVCDASGSCIACTQGAACTPTNECHVGTVDCSTGAIACKDSGASVADGTNPIGCTAGTHVCAGGACVACASGGSCTTNSDGCALGIESCATGAQQCANGAADPSMAGQPCTIGSSGTCTGGKCVCPAGQEFYGGDCNACPSFGTTTTVYVDAAKGTDDLCCGRSQKIQLGGPCKTITHAMKQVGGAVWTINFTGDANGNASSSETYPLSFSNGTYLAGQGSTSSCIPGVAGKPVIQISTDAQAVYIGGVTLGTQCGATTPAPSAGIWVANGGQGLVWYDVQITNVTDGIHIAPSSTCGTAGAVIHGVTNGVNIDGGTWSSNGPTTISNVTDGIHCTSVTSTSAISGNAGQASAIITGATRYGVYAGPGCNLTGASPSPGSGFEGSIGPATCDATRPDGIGIYLEGNAAMEIGWGAQSVISCMNGDGIVLANNAALTGSPSLTLSGYSPITIRNNGGAGIRALAGLVTAYNTTITGNHWGVVQQSSASSTDPSKALIDLTGMSNYTAGLISPNTIYCNGKTEAGEYCTAGSCPNGANVWNNSGLPLLVQNTYWADSPLSKCLWDSVHSKYACTGSAAGSTTPPDQIDILTSPFTTGATAGSVDFTGALVLTTATCSY
ncbi:MAG: hypothetical protein ACHREM_18070 [Polyangiales bacterium]